MAQTLRKINELMAKIVERCPAYVFLTALPQLASRICHSHKGKEIIKTQFIKLYFIFKLFFQMFGIFFGI